MCVTKRKGPLPSPDTFPDLLLTLVALSGELPSALVSRLPAPTATRRMLLKPSSGKGSFAPTTIMDFAACV